MTVCMTVLGTPTRVLVVVWGVDMGPLLIIKPKNGFGFAPAMGLNGVICRSGSDWYDSKSESKVV